MKHRHSSGKIQGSEYFQALLVASNRNKLGQNRLKVSKEELNTRPWKGQGSISGNSRLHSRVWTSPLLIDSQLNSSDPWT